MTAIRLALATVGVGALAVSAVGAERAPGDSPSFGRVAADTEQVVGRSVGGQPIVARRIGSRRADRVVLVVGEIHGTEPAGRAVVRRLRSVRPPRGTALVLVETANPDGGRDGTRWNAHGVDLNRNFPFGWKPGGVPFDTYHSGPAPASEPETRALLDLIERVRPRVTVWYHQHMRLVDRSGGDPHLERLYATRARLPYRRIAPLPGTATGWQNATFPRDSAFVVELPAGRLSRAAVDRHAGAVLAVARAIAPPPVVQTPIPFGPLRRREMRAYANRHYAIDDYRLRRPRVIVEHYTASNSFSSAFETFAADTPDVELGELPGVCAHYLIDRDGTIHQLVPLRLMCRHVVGLNHVAIGIEHVGTSDEQVMAFRTALGAAIANLGSARGRPGRTTEVVA